MPFGILTAASWLLSNWKIVLAALAALAVAITLFVVERHGYQRRVQQEAAETVKVLQGRIETMQEVAKRDALRNALSNKRIRELESKARETPPNSGDCLDRDAARRVQSIR